MTKDVELRYAPNGTCIANFSLAVNRRFKQEGQPEADFFNIVAFGKTGEFCGNYFSKGQQVLVEGRLQTRSYDNKEGKKVYVTEVVCEAVYFADSKKEANNEQKNDNTNFDSENPFTIVDDNGLPF